VNSKNFKMYVEDFNIFEICSGGNKVYVFIIHLYIHSSMALQPFVGLWPLLWFLIFFYRW
jgi:hypothetical protein